MRYIYYSVKPREWVRGDATLNWLGTSEDGTHHIFDGYRQIMKLPNIDAGVCICIIVKE